MYLHFLNQSCNSVYIDIDTGDVLWILPKNISLDGLLCYVTHLTEDGTRTYFERLEDGETMWTLPEDLSEEAIESCQIIEELDTDGCIDLIGDYDIDQVQNQEDLLDSFLDKLAGNAHVHQHTREHEIELAKGKSHHMNSKTTLKSNSSNKKNNNSKKTSSKYIHILNRDEIPVYVDSKTGKASWLLPNDIINLKQAVIIMSHVNEDGSKYFETLRDGVTHWSLPETIPKAALQACSRISSMDTSKCEALLKQRYPEAASNEQETDLLDSIENDADEEGDDDDDDDDDEIEERSSHSNSFGKSKSKSKSKDKDNAKGNQNNVDDDSGAVMSGGFLNVKRKPLVRYMFEMYATDDPFISATDLQKLCYEYGVYLSIEDVQKSISKSISKSSSSSNSSEDSNSLEYEEFMVWWRTRSEFNALKLSDNKIQQKHAACKIFAGFDKKKIGQVSTSTFSKVYEELLDANLIPLQNVRDIIRILDKDDMGKIQFSNFIPWFESVRRSNAGVSISGTFSFSLFGLLGGNCARTGSQDDHRSPTSPTSSSSNPSSPTTPTVITSASKNSSSSKSTSKNINNSNSSNSKSSSKSKSRNIPQSASDDDEMPPESVKKTSKKKKITSKS